MADEQLLERITVDPRVMVGKPVIRGTRLTVEYILNLLADGTPQKEILEEYEGLAPEDIQACLLFATRSRSLEPCGRDPEVLDFGRLTRTSEEVGKVVMKRLQLSEDILPLGELKTQASRVLRQLRTSRRPVVITQNGRAAAVLITPEEFDRWRENEHFLAAVQDGLADVEAGRTLPDEEVERLLDAEFGRLEPA